MHGLTYSWFLVIAGQVSNAHALSSVTPREVKNTCMYVLTHRAVHCTITSYNSIKIRHTVHTNVQSYDSSQLEFLLYIEQPPGVYV